MSFARLELLPLGVLDLALSKLTYELVRANCVSSTCDHIDHLGTGWLRQMDIGARARVAMSNCIGLFLTLDVVHSGRRSLSEVRCSRSASAEWRSVMLVHSQRA